MEKEKGYLHTLDEVKHKKIKMFCVEQGMPMKKFYDEAVEEYLKKVNAKDS